MNKTTTQKAFRFPATNEEFAAQVIAAARQVTGEGRCGQKVFISAIMDRLNVKGTIAFKAWLLECLAAGSVKLARFDMGGGEMARRSEIESFGCTFHCVIA